MVGSQTALGQAIVAVVLFGLVHPLSKPLLNSGLEPQLFALSFLLCRLAMTLPLVRPSAIWRLLKQHPYAIFGIGLGGAVLQISEFEAIAAGVPVQVVSFLVFTVPLWTAVFSLLLHAEPIKKSEAVSALLILAGGYLVVQGSLGQAVPLDLLLWPLAAGIGLGLWIVISAQLRREGVGTMELSVMCDLATLVLMLAVITPNTSSAVWHTGFSWLADPINLISILAYTALLGVTANYLFYRAAKNISAPKLGLIMTLDPLVSAGVSYLLLGERFSLSQFSGALLIIVAHGSGGLIGLRASLSAGS